MAFTDHVIIFITLVVFYSVSSEEYSVFVLTGGSVTLDIPTDELPQFNTLVWMKGKAENIVRFTREPRVIKPYSPYMDGMEFNTETFSPTLKNMQKTDSGIYRVRTTRENETDDIVYGVSVLNAVESPVLTVVSNWSSIDFCTVIVTCRGQDLTLSSTYLIDSCSRVEMASSRIITLILHFTEYSIICNHSNPVSWKSETKDTEQLCSLHKSVAMSTPAGVSLCLLKTVLFSVPLMLMMSAVIIVHIREKLRCC